MHKQAKDAIHDLVLDLRKTLEGEVERELGRYGIYADRAWIDASTLSRLSAKERDEDRPRIEAAIRREQDAGLDQAGAVRAFIRETAYTHMNRLLGLKCMDVRGLIEETITTRPIYSERSKRHRDYLDEHPQAHRAPDRGLVAMLQQAYTEISQQIGVVFDPDSDYSIVWPRHTLLKEYIDQINNLDAEVARKRGEEPETITSVYADDTVLGWVYQYFQEEEKARVFREVRTKKISGHDIIPATTAYTERYMVQFLVENSLGALWMEMYPDSDLCEQWEYFVEDPNLQNEDGTRKRGRDRRPVAELALLDPASGSGHFLLYSFDLFAQLYEAEAQMQSRPVNRAEIARRILRDNLHGIDIDLRSIQLSALNLYMKACTYAGVHLNELQNSEPVRMNLVCADIVLREGPELAELLERFKGDPLTQDLIETLWRGLQNARELGSLLKVEEQVDAVIARKREAERGTFWEHADEDWERWKQGLLDVLKDYVDRAAEAFDVNRRMFGQEAIKGVRLLDLLTRRYDVVITNPPYVHNRNMGESLRQGMRTFYPNTGSDLFAAFMERSWGLTESKGYFGLVTQQSFMFLRSYIHLRQLIIQKCLLRMVAHLGSHAFEEISGEKVNTVLVSASKGNPPKSHTATFIDATSQPAKDIALQETDAAPRYLRSQESFTSIDGIPLTYWIPHEIRSLFEGEPDLSGIATPKAGINTGDNSRFLRFWWEVTSIEPGETKAWVPYMKGGTYDKWLGNLEYVVYLDTEEMLKLPGARMRENYDYFFNEGITYTLTSSTGFSGRYMPPGYAFDMTGSCVFVHGSSLFYVLGYLNSSLAAYFLASINPSWSFQIGDLARLPFHEPDPPKRGVVERCVQHSKEEKHFLVSARLEECIFSNSLMERACSDDSITTLRGAYALGLEQAELAETRILIYEGLIDKLILDVYDLSDETKKIISASKTTAPRGQSLLCAYETFPDDLIPEAYAYLDTLPRITTEGWVSSHRVCSLNVSDLPSCKLLEFELIRLYVGEGRSLEEICATLKLNPISIVALRRELGLINPADLKHEVENFLTHRIWELGKQDEDGIIPYDDGLQNPSLLAQVRGEIEAVFDAGRAVDIETEMDQILGRGGLARWLGDPFFQKHVRQFKKRPILWQITSPGKRFRVLVYYHKLDHDTLSKVRSQYLWPLLERARTQLRAAQDQDPPDLKTVSDLEAYIADLEECDGRLESVIQSTIEVDLPEWANGPYRDGKPPYDPDLDDGVRVNILPLQAAGLLPMRRVV